MIILISAVFGAAGWMFYGFRRSGINKLKEEVQNIETSRSSIESQRQQIKEKTRYIQSVNALTIPSGYKESIKDQMEKISLKILALSLIYNKLLGPYKKKKAKEDEERRRREEEASRRRRAAAAAAASYSSYSSSSSSSSSSFGGGSSWGGGGGGFSGGGASGGW